MPNLRVWQWVCATLLLGEKNMVGEMTFQIHGASALDYFQCRYGKSKILFRGPKRRLSGDFALFLGGTETYGKFVPDPFPAIIERETGVKCINFGCVNAGVDAFLHDPTVIDAAQAACVTVVQVMGAQNMSNRFYSVHPRRNDRFLKASNLMRQVFRDVDFTEYNFTRHLLCSLRRRSPDRYAMVVEELQEAWRARMGQLLQKIQGKTILLWAADHRPEADMPDHDLGSDPLFVDRRMIEAMRPNVTQVVEVTASPQTLAMGAHGLVLGPLDLAASKDMLGTAFYQDIGAALSPVIADLMPKR